MNKDDDFVFDGFEPSNTTAVPDVLFDVLLSQLSGAELKVLLYIIRRTRGFKKDTDAISLTQFEKGITTRDNRVLDTGCGLNRETICKALQSLEAMGCIKSQKRSNARNEKDVTLYSIRFKNTHRVVGKSDHTQAENPTTVVVSSDHRSRKTPSEVVGKSDIQQTVLQQTVKQETESDASRVSPTPPISSSAQEREEKPQQGSLMPDPKKKSGKQVEASPQAQVIIERWIAATGGKPLPMTKALVEAAESLVECNPSKETLVCVKNFAYQHDTKGWYRQHGGVKLGDIVREYEGWQNSQNQAQAEQTTPPPQPTHRNTLNLEENHKWAARMAEKTRQSANRKG